MNLLQFLNNAVGGPPQHGRSGRCNEVSRYYDPTPTPRCLADVADAGDIPANRDDVGDDESDLERTAQTTGRADRRS